MKVLMVGVDKQTKGGMWSVVENYLNDKPFCEKVNLKYIPTSITGSKVSRILFTFRAYLKIFFSLIKDNYDIVHVHMSERGSVYRKNIVISMAKCFHCKTVLHMHGAEFEKWYLKSDEKKQSFVRDVVNRADSVLILGEYWKPFISSLLTDKRKLKVLYNAVKVESANQYNEKARDFLFLGAVVERKGIYDLLDAFADIDSQLDEDCRLLIYGPDFDGRIGEEIAKRNLENRVIYKGWLDKSKRNEVFSEVSVNILPSYNEGLPMTILETMAYGIPSITTEIAAIPEAVNDSNGYLIAPGDKGALSAAVLESVKNSDLRIAKSKSAYNTAKEKFSIEHHINELLKVYEDLKR